MPPNLDGPVDSPTRSPSETPAEAYQRRFGGSEPVMRLRTQLHFRQEPTMPSQQESRDRAAVPKPLIRPLPARQGILRRRLKTKTSPPNVNTEHYNIIDTSDTEHFCIADDEAPLGDPLMILSMIGRMNRHQSSQRHLISRQRQAMLLNPKG